jgi:hypothetical protein
MSNNRIVAQAPSARLPKIPRLIWVVSLAVLAWLLVAGVIALVWASLSGLTT